MVEFLTTGILSDFGIISIVIVLSHLIRSRIKFLQYLYMPSSVIAGIICLFAGKQFLDILPFAKDDNGNALMATYPAFLVVFIFATVFLGKKKKELSATEMMEHAGDTFFYNMSSLVGQYGFALLFGIVVLTPLFPLLPNGFAIFLPAGFIGGYGTATAIGGVLEQNGWEDALTIGYTSATIGMLTSVFAGMIIINIATRHGWTRMVDSVQKMPKSMRTGFVEKSQRQSMGLETVSPVALDPLTWHIAIVFSIGIFAFLLRDGLRFLIPGQFDVPVFCLALLLGAFLQKLFNIIKVGEYIDRHIIHRIGSSVTDYLIAFGISSIKIMVVLKYAVPLTLLFIFGFVFTIGLIWFLGQRICRNFWFERSMAVYGWSTGSIATSIMLLRIIDPDLKTPVLEDFGLAYLGISFVEIAIISMLPALILNDMIAIPTLILLVSFVACIVLSRFLVGWFPYKPNAIRPGEEEIMKGNLE